MKAKLILWISVFFFNLSIALAQTGLFDTGTSQDFAILGIILIVVIIIGRNIVKGNFKIRSF